jgi:hypothetical protein
MRPHYLIGYLRKTLINRENDSCNDWKSLKSHTPTDSRGKKIHPCTEGCPELEKRRSNSEKPNATGLLLFEEAEEWNYETPAFDFITFC